MTDKAHMRGALAALLLTTAASPALAAIQSDPTLPEYRGEPVSQTFLGGDASFVRARDGAAACVASRAVPVAEAVYIEADGSRTPFAEVTRSRGASLQYIVKTDGSPAFWRLQLKYPVSGVHPAMMEIDGEAYDMSALREPSGDSFALSDPALAMTLRDAFERGADVRFTAHSEDTGRTVIDRLDGPRFEAVDSCQHSAAFISEGPEPSNDISIALDAPMIAANRAAPEVVTACAMTETTDPIYYGVLRSTTGFFAQTQKALVAYDDNGSVSRVYVPGVFDARPDGFGGFDSRISISADSNLPISENAVKGCLGDDVAALSWLSGEDTPDIVLGPRFGDLVAGDFLEGVTPAEFLNGNLPGTPLPASPVNTRPRLANITEPRSDPPNFTPPSTPTGPGSSPKRPPVVPTDGGGGNQPQPPQVVPLPMSAAILVSGLAALGALGLRRRR